MGVKAYYYSDASAPVLTGEDGALVNVLKKCLINGYGAKTPPGSGWTGSFNAGVTKGTFRPQLGTRCSLWMDDHGSATGTFRWARVRGVESYDSLDGNGDLVNPSALFPTVEQKATPPNFYKSYTADNTGRAWAVFADEYCFYLFTWPAATYEAVVYFFGDVVPFKSDDAFHCFLAANAVAETASPIAGGYNYHGGQLTGAALGAASWNTPCTGAYFARDYDQIGKSYSAAFASLGLVFGSTGYPGAGGPIYPNGADNALVTVPGYLTTINPTAANSVLRGVLPGWSNPLHSGTSLANFITISGLSGMAGRTYQWIKLQAAASVVSAVVMDITGPWR